MRLDMVTNVGKRPILGARLDATVDGPPQGSSAGSASLARRDCRGSRNHTRAVSSVERRYGPASLFSNGSIRAPEDVRSRPRATAASGCAQGHCAGLSVATERPAPDGCRSGNHSTRGSKGQIPPPSTAGLLPLRNRDGMQLMNGRLLTALPCPGPPIARAIDFGKGNRGSRSQTVQVSVDPLMPRPIP